MLSRSYPISIRAAALAKKKAEPAGACDIMVTYLDTGGAAQNASMTSLQIRFSKDVPNGKERLDRILKSWPFLVGLTNIQRKKPTKILRISETEMRMYSLLSSQN